MKNTIENKRKFFSQYYDVPCIENEDWIWQSKQTFKYLPHDSEIDNAYLLLKPISEINNEDSICVAKINGYDNDQVYYGEKIVSGYANLFIETNIGFMHTVDFLRSKGYALPYMGLSIEKLIEYGWIKLKTK